MKHGNERRALPAARDIGGTKIMDDFDPGSRRESVTVADLDGQVAAGPVQDSLSVEPDQIDRRPADGTRRQKSFDGFRMAIGDHRISARQRPGTGVAILKQDGILDCPAQQGPVRFGIRIRSRRAKNDPFFAIGLDQGNVNAIHRGAAHETYRTKHVNCFPWQKHTFCIIWPRVQRPPRVIVAKTGRLHCRALNPKSHRSINQGIARLLWR